MIPTVLTELASEDLDREIGAVLQPKLLRKRLRTNDRVREVQRALNSGEVVDGEVGEFVSSLVKQFRPGTRFEFDLPLAGLAVALETRGTNFAGDYLANLAKLRLAELPWAPRLAALCLEHRNQTMALTEVRVLQVTAPSEHIEMRPSQVVPASQRPTSVELNCHANP